jgi:hypothetical protein
LGREEVAEQTTVGEGECGGREREEGGFFCEVVGGVSLRTILGFVEEPGAVLDLNFVGEIRDWVVGYADESGRSRSVVWDGLSQ